MTGTVIVYRSTDTSAPTLAGTTGSLVALLDAVLVNGYGSQAAAGWSIAYTGTSKRAYTMASGGTGCSIYIDDTGPGAASYREARVSGFKTVTGLGAGTGQFPSTSQMLAPSGALVIRKSTTADSTSRAWTVIADGHTVYLFLETGDNSSGLTTAYPFLFGDFFATNSTDTNNCMIIGRNTENQSNTGYDPLGQIAGNTDTLASVGLGQYIASSWTGVGGPVPFGKYLDNVPQGSEGNNQAPGPTGGTVNGNLSIGRNSSPQNNPYPDPCSGGLVLSPIRINHSGATRGYLKGLWAPMHDRPLNHNDVVTISGGNLNGKQLLVQNIPSYVNESQNNGQILVEISNTWA